MKKHEIIMWIIIALGALLILGGFGFGRFGYNMMGMMYGNYGFNMMFFGWIYVILALTALILLIIWLFKQVRKK